LNIEHKSAEKINLILREHQTNAQDWCFSSIAADLHTWAERMVLYFKIQSVTIPALLVERLRRRRGHYRSGRNGFGIIDEIAIDQSHVQSGPYWEVLGTLAHEIIHFWQEHNGQPPATNRRNYHNRQYREKALEIGLLVNQCGHTQYVQDESLFLMLLKKHGVQVPEVFEPDSHTHGCKSSLRLYQCKCGVKVRVGRSHFNARCLDCETLFMEKK
jgi:hypothetical protein